MFNLALWVYVGLALAIFGSLATVWGPGVKDPVIRTINTEVASVGVSLILIKASKNTIIDNGSRTAVKKATSKYLKLTIAKTKPASKTETIITLSNGFFRRTTPIAPIIIKAIDIVVKSINSNI